MSCIKVDQNFLDWNKKYGIKFTVEQYVKHGDFLPRLTDFENTEFPTLSESQLQEEINRLLPEGVFNIDNINNIVVELPKEAKAAFFDRVLYFGENSTKKEIEVKEGVDFVFYSNEELKSIGSPKEYTEYISTVFPNSKIKDIVYHSRFTLSNITNKDRWRNGFYSGTKEQADLMAEMAEDSNEIMITSALLINVQNPKITNYKDRNVENYKNTNDSFIIKATEQDALQLINGRDGYNTDNFKNEYVVFEPEQIHILGSKQDTEGFKKWKQNNDKKGVTKKEVAEEAFHAIFQTLIKGDRKQEFLTIGKQILISKLGATTVKQHIAELRKLYPATYSQMSEREAMDRAYEETIANEFVNWYSYNPVTFLEQQIADFPIKSLPTSAKSLLVRFFNWIRSLFNSSLRDRTKLELFFKDIRDGQYRKSNIVNENADKFPTTRLIQFEDEDGNTVTLSSGETQEVIRNVAQVYLKLKDSVEDTEDISIKKSEIVDIVMGSILNSLPTVPLANWQKLAPLFEKEIYNDLTEETETNVAYSNLKEDVIKYLNDQFDEKLGEEDDEENQMMLWSDAVSANEKGMEDSMSKWLKAYIGTTGDLVYDEFNNPVFITVDLGGVSKQVPLIQVVDTNRVYYGLARALSNSQHEIDRLKKLKDFSSIEGNSASSSFFNKIMDDVLENPTAASKEAFKASIDEVHQQIKKSGYKNIGLINNLAGIREDRKYIIQSVLKGFDFWVRDNWVNTIDGKDGKLLSKVFSANSNSVVNNQIGQFKDGLSTYIQQESKAKGTDIAALGKRDYASLFNQYNAFERLKRTYNLQVSNYTLKYILALRQEEAELTDEAELQARTEAIDKFFPEFRTFKEYIGEYNASPIVSLFTKTFPQFTAEQLQKWDIAGDVKDLAEINAYFDEALTESSYKNAENKNIYTYQYKTQHLAYLNYFMHNEQWWKDKAAGITHEYADGKFLESNRPFFTENYYVKKFADKNWKKFLTKLKHISIDGINFNDEANTFGGMTNKDFNVLRLNLAFREKQRKENGITVRPLLVGVLESKRTADFVEITDVKNKITKTIQNEFGIDEQVVETQDLFIEGAMTSATQDLIKDEIKKEYNRIKEQSVKITEALVTLGEGIIKTDEKTGEKYILITNALISSNQSVKQKFGDVFEGFHTGRVLPKYNGEGQFIGFNVTKGSPRALEFSDALKGFMENKEAEIIRKRALENPDLTFANSTITTVASQYELLYQAHLTELRNQGILVGELLPYNPYVKYAELKEYFLSSMLNAIYINQLIHGDNALLYKNDGVDMNKRFGGRNAAIVSMKTGFTNTALGVNTPTAEVRVVVGNEIVQKSGVDNKDIDAADAQTWKSVNMKRKFLHSQNKLTKPVADILTKIEYGVPVSDKENAYLKKNSIYFNVDKPVGFDGYIYIKTGAMMLTKDITSVFTGTLVDKDGNRISRRELPEKIENYTQEQIATLLDEKNWKPIKGSEFLHGVRKAMYEHGFDLYAPKSASKMLTANMYNADYNSSTIKEDVKNSIMKIDADFYGLQMENPAGKLRIFDPSQNQEIVVNELNELYIIRDGETKLKIDLLQEYQNLLSQRDNVAMLQATKELYDAKGFRWKNFLSKAQDTLASSGADVQTLTFYTPDANGNKQYNPNMSITLEKFVNLFFSHFSKGVLQQKVAGDALAHVSSFGFKPLKKVVKYNYKGVDVYSWEVVQRNTTEWRQQLDGASILEFGDNEKNFIYDETDEFSQLDFTTEDTALIGKLKSLGEGAYFIDDLRHNKPRWNVNESGVVNESTPYLGTFTEAMLPTYNPKIKITKYSRWMQGVRIPSQDKHSAVNIEWVDSLPEYYGNTIITAKEIVQLSGSDFDIDKLFLNKPELKEDGTKYTDTWEDYVEFQVTENKSVKKLLKQYAKEEDISDDEAFVTIVLGEKEAKYKYLIPKALKELQLPSTEQEYKESYTKNIGAINNEILEIRQLALTNDETLKAKYFNPEGEQISKLDYIQEEGYYKVEAIYKTPATQDELKETLANDPDFKNLDIFNKNFVYSIHSWLAQSLSHKNTTTGKKNIAVSVNANLLAIALRRMDINFLYPTIIKYGEKEVGNSSVKDYVYGGKRLFDMISTLISAATDEAKDQQNAKYNLTIPRLNIMIPLLLQGHSMKVAIAVVNHPSLKGYFDMLSTKENKVQNETEQKRRYEKDIDILSALFFSLPASNKEFTQENIIADLKSGGSEMGKYVVQSAINALKTMEEINPIMDFVKLKRGIGKSTDDWEKLLESHAKLFPEEIPLESYTDVYSKIKYFDGQLTNYANILFNNPETALETKMQDLFVHYKPETKEFYQGVKNELKTSNSRRFKEVVDNELMSYLYSKLYYKHLQTVNPAKLSIYNEVYNDTKTVVNKIRALLQYIDKNKGDASVEVFEKNTFLNKIKFGANSAARILEIPTFSKMSGKDQTSLIDGFESLFRSTLNLNITENIDNTEVTVDGKLADELFAYFVVKDGWLFRKGSLSKAISPFFFKEHSVALEEYLSRKYFNEEQMNATVIDATTAFALNEKNMKYISQVMSAVTESFDGKNYNILTISKKGINLDLEQATKFLEKTNEGKTENKTTLFDVFYRDSSVTSLFKVQEGVHVFSAPLFLVNDKKLYKLDSVGILEQGVNGLFGYNTYRDVENIHNYRKQSLRKASYVPINFVSLGDRKTLTTSPKKMQLSLFEKPKEEVSTLKGINISSKSEDWLGKALTNPTYSKYQIPDSKGNLFDVESIYKANQSLKTAPQLSFDEALKYDMNLMAKLQIQKFLKYPELIEEIDKRGGVEFIENSSHIIGSKKSRWEGKGTESNFIKVLSASYTKAKQQLTDIVKVETLKVEKGVPSEYTNYSGKAEGSDAYWAEVGKEFGIGKQVDYTVDTLKKLDPENQKEVETAYQTTVKKLGRKSLPYDWNNPDLRDANGKKVYYSGGLVRRDYLQAKAGDAIFAVSSFENGNYKQMKVKGGTAYAVQMGLDLGKSVYFFDQELNKWFLMDTSLSEKPIELAAAPTLTKKFTGVGTRELNENGKKAIRDVYENTFPTKVEIPTTNKINIYAGTNENAELSNFAVRPFKFSVQPIVSKISGLREFDSVEQAFQWHKGLFSESPADFAGSGSKTVELMRAIKSTKNGAEIKKLGSQFNLIKKKSWDEYSNVLMEELLLESFEQNPDALKILLATGNSELTHTQDKGKWGREFPRLLMKVRDKLKAQTSIIDEMEDNDFIGAIDPSEVDEDFNPFEGIDPTNDDFGDFDLGVQANLINNLITNVKYRAQGDYAGNLGDRIKNLQQNSESLWEEKSDSSGFYTSPLNLNKLYNTISKEDLQLTFEELWRKSVQTKNPKYSYFLQIFFADRLFQKEDGFLGKLFNKEPRGKVVFSQYRNGFSASGDSIFLNIHEQLVDNIFYTVEDFKNGIELILTEEVIHYVMQKITPKSEFEALYDSLSKEEIERVKEIYTFKNPTKFLVANEYIRMIIQEKYLDTHTERELHRKIYDMVLRLFQYLKEMFTENELGNLLVKRFDTFLNTNNEGTEKIDITCIR